MSLNRGRRVFFRSEATICCLQNVGPLPRDLPSTLTLSTQQRLIVVMNVSKAPTDTEFEKCWIAVAAHRLRHGLPFQGLLRQAYFSCVGESLALAFRSKQQSCATTIGWGNTSHGRDRRRRWQRRRNPWMCCRGRFKAFVVTLTFSPWPPKRTTTLADVNARAHAKLDRLLLREVERRSLPTALG